MNAIKLKKKKIFITQENFEGIKKNWMSINEWAKKIIKLDKY